MKRSPWFNARTDPPVNGGDDAVYEWRCSMTGFDLRRAFQADIKNWGSHCPFCQWRGLLREDGDVPPTA